jgi:pimeloyl-ACP methyl ester carboxylesterase
MPVVESAEQYHCFTNEELQQQKPPEKARTALLVVHGMGQQRKFETLSQVASGIESHSGPATAKRVKVVRIGEECFSRVELDLPDRRGVDIYEAYWAPITEGAVTLRDVILFLCHGAWSGIRHTKKKKFSRWVFGAEREYKVGEKTRSVLLLTLGVIASLIFLNAAMMGLAAPKVLQAGPGWLVSPPLLHDFTAMILMLFAVAAGFAALYLAAGRQRAPGKHLTKPLLVSRLGVLYFILTCLYTCLLAVVTLLAIEFHHAPRGAWLFVGTGAGDVFVWMTAALLAFAAIICIIAIGRSHKKALEVVSVLVLVALAAGVIFLASGRSTASTLEEGLPVPELSVFDHVPDLHVPAAAMMIVARLWVVVWVALVLLSAFVRSFLVQFAGDVAAYVTPNVLDRFDTIRTRIKDRVRATAEAIYRAGTADALLYDSVVIVGHSLGSVCAYDVVNKMLSEDGYAQKAMRVLKRTKGLVTFGSPLDKTAFIFDTNVSERTRDRAALAATVQPLIADRATRSIVWKNVYSSWDIFAGELNYYSEPDDDKRVDNRLDFDAVTPVGAHNEYWNNGLLWELVSDLIPKRPDALPTDGWNIPIGPRDRPGSEARP